MIDKCKQFNTKEADTLQTTEFSEIPKIFWDIRIALLFGIFCKAEVFFNFVNQNSKKNSSFPKFQKIYQLAQIFLEFWNFGKLEVFLEFWTIPKKPKFFLEFDPKTSKNLRFFFGIS